MTKQLKLHTRILEDAIPKRRFDLIRIAIIIILVLFAGKQRIDVFRSGRENPSW